MSDRRVILYHKHPSSARTLFLRVNGTVCLFDGLPEHAGGAESSEEIDSEIDRSIVSPAERRFGLPEGSLEIEREFLAAIETEKTPIPTYLARFTGIDPPAGSIEGEFISITQARTLPATELRLLQLAYDFIME
ncbi:hypothetical protein V0288_14780 [Pannus brasiliensis CCIBt3594]|uniref:NUDIX hydrolase n=1 Tax=Pannus brasiliensis CCIBt3594 TaxID=1427578 RepID=A0AAW9QXC8_9CHRO